MKQHQKLRFRNFSPNRSSVESRSRERSHSANENNDTSNLSSGTNNQIYLRQLQLLKEIELKKNQLLEIEYAHGTIKKRLENEKADKQFKGSTLNSKKHSAGLPYDNQYMSFSNSFDTRKKGPANVDVIASSNSQYKFNPKKPSEGGGIRTQKYMESLMEDKRQEVRQRNSRQQSPLRQKRSRSPFPDGETSLSLRELNNDLPVDRNSQSPLRMRSKSPPQARELPPTIHQFQPQPPPIYSSYHSNETIEQQNNRYPVVINAAVPESYSSDVHFKLQKVTITSPKFKHQYPKLTQEYYEDIINRETEKLRDQNQENFDLRRKTETVSEELKRINYEKLQLERKLNDKREEVRSLKQKYTAMADEAEHELRSPRDVMLKDSIRMTKLENEKFVSHINDVVKFNQKFDESLIKADHIAKTQQHDRKFLQDEIESKQSRISEINLETERVLTLIEVKNQQVGSAQEEINQIRTQIEQLETEIEALMKRRKEILDKVCDLSEKYNRERMMTNYETQRFRDKHLWDTKKVAVRVVTKVLQIAVDSRKDYVMKELKAYSQFDKDCYRKLKNFQQVCFNLGKYREQVALQTWYLNSLKPIDTAKQNDGIVKKLADTALKLKVFNSLRKQVQQKKERLAQQGGSMQVLKKVLFQNLNKDLKWALRVWKSQTDTQLKIQSKIRRLIVEKQINQLQWVIQHWRNYSFNLDFHCRLHLLKCEYSQKLLLSQIFQAIRREAFRRKHQRIFKKHLVLKAWKNWMAQRQQKIKQNILSLTFMASNKVYLFRACFDALKQNGVSSKYEIIKKSLEEDVKADIKEFSNFNADVTSTIRHKDTIRASQTVRNMIGRRLQEYFTKWKGERIVLNQNVNSKVKDKIYRMYAGYLSSYFSHWRKNATQKKIKAKKKMIMSMEQEGQDLQEQSIVAENNERVKQEEVRRTRHKVNNKVFKKFIYRIIKQGFDKWKTRIKQIKTSKKKNNNVLFKWKIRLEKQAFQTWLDMSKKITVSLRNDESSQHFEQFIRHKRLQNKFYQLKTFTQKYKKAKRYFKRFLIKQHAENLERMFKLWKQQNHKKKIRQLQNLQNEEAINLENLMHQNGVTQRKSEEQVKLNEKMNKEVLKKGRRVIANYLARQSSVSVKAGFDHWKSYLNYQVKKNRVIKHMVEREKLKQMQAVARAFKRFIYKENVQIKKKAIKQVMVESDEQQTSIDYQNDLIEQERVRVKKETVQSKSVIIKKQHNLEGTVNALIRKNQDLVFASKKRAIFEAWRFSIRKELGSIMSIENVITKTLLMKAFTVIRDCSHVSKTNDRKYQIINKAFLKYHRQTIQALFVKWKQSMHKQVETNNIDWTEKINEATTTNDDWVKKAKTQNIKNVEKHYEERKLKKYFDALVNWVEDHSMKRVQGQETELALGCIRQKRVLQKWYMRMQKTKEVRMKTMKLKEWHQLRQQKKVLKTLRMCRNRTKRLNQSLSNFEKVIRVKLKIDAMKAIKFHGDKLLDTYLNDRKYSTTQICQRLCDKRLNLLKTYFNRFHQQARQHTIERNKLKSVLIKMNTSTFRGHFEKWKAIVSKEQLVQEMNETGPVTAEVLEARRMLKNLEQFMRDEGYTEDEIKNIVDKVKQSGNQRMLWALKRLQMDPEKRSQFYCYEKWKQWVRMRKLMKYQLRFCNNMCKPVICDLQRAFRKWLYSDRQLAKHLSTFDYKSLQDMKAKQSHQLDQLADHEAENNAALKYLTVQRDDLLERFIASQKIAIIYIMDNFRKRMMRSWDKWVIFVENDRGAGGTAAVGAAMLAIGEKKAQMQELELENENMAEEIDQLRSFEVQGKQLRKQKKKLESEKDTLDYNLELAEIEVKKLLDQNKDLKKKVANLPQKPDDDNVSVQ